MIVAIGDAQAASRIVALMKHEFPLVPVLARAFDREHALALVAQGVDYQIRETFESALSLGREALLRLGETPEEADAVIAEGRQRDAERFALDQAGGLRAGAGLLFGNRGQTP